MKKMNRLGFTLIELLAVVVILLAISIIAVSSISAAIERNKAKQDNAKKDIIISYAKLYYDENKNELDRNINNYGQAYINIRNDLTLTEDERKKTNGDFFEGCVKVTPSSTGKKFEYIDTCP